MRCIVFAAALVATSGVRINPGANPEDAHSGWVEHHGEFVPLARLPPHVLVPNNSSSQLDVRVLSLKPVDPADWSCTQPTPPHLEGTSNCSIAILIPTLGGNRTLELLQTMFGSMAAKASSKCRLGLFLSYDHPGDSWYANASNRASVEAVFRKAVDEPKREWMELIWVQNIGERTFASAVNTAASDAHAAGFTYLYQMGDDIEFAAGSENWDAIFAEELRRMDDFGATGSPYDLLVRAFVGRSHLCAFGTFYPTELKNFYTDDWIGKIYGDMGRRDMTAFNTSISIVNTLNNRYVTGIDFGARQIWEGLANSSLDRSMRTTLCDPARYSCETPR